MFEVSIIMLNVDVSRVIISNVVMMIQVSLNYSDTYIKIYWYRKFIISKYVKTFVIRKISFSIARYPIAQYFPLKLDLRRAFMWPLRYRIKMLILLFTLATYQNNHSSNCSIRKTSEAINMKTFRMKTIWT